MAEDHTQDAPEQEHTPTQQTKPRGQDAKGRRAKPIEIPVPKRDEVERILTRAARPAEADEKRKE